MKAAKGSGRRLLFVLFFIVSYLTASADITFANEAGSEVTSSLQGNITDEHGDPVDGAFIQIGTYAPNQGFGIVAHASTNEEGEYAIPSYTRHLGDAVSAIITVNEYIVVYELQSQTLDFQIPAQRATLSGKLTYPDPYETPAAGCEIHLGVHLGSGGGRINIASAITDAEGNYSFSIIPGDFNSAIGENRFRFILDDVTERHIELHLGDSLVINEYVYNIPPGTKLNGRVIGFITDENEVPITDAEVELIGSDIPVTPADGLFVTDILKGGPHTLKITAPGFLPLEETVEVNGDNHVALVLTRGILDHTPPVTTALLSDGANPNNWYNTDVHVTLSSDDNLSGVENTEYSLDDGSTWTDYHGSFAITEEGSNMIQYRSIDKAGNVEQTKTLDIHIDKTPPTLTITPDKTVLFPANHKMVSINAKVEVSDSASGLGSVVLTSITSFESSYQPGSGHTSNDVHNADYGTFDTTFDLRAERSGKGNGRVYTITYTATDQAGNVNVSTAAVTVPKKK